MSKAITFLGAVTTVYGLILFLLSNLNLGVILTVLIGIVIFLLGVYKDRIKSLTVRGIGKVIKICAIVLLCCEFMLAGLLFVYGNYDNIDYSEDAVIVFGAGVRGENVTLPLKMRLDRAVEYHTKNPEALIVVSGGQGLQETVTEAYAMEKYLISKGVDKAIIIKEEKATSTNENVRFSKKILDKMFEKEYKAVVITNNFHVYRSVSIAKREGLAQVTHMHAEIQWYNIIPCYLRESLAVLKMWVFG